MSETRQLDDAKKWWAEHHRDFIGEDGMMNITEILAAYDAGKAVRESAATPGQPTQPPERPLEPGEFYITRGDGVQERCRYVGQSVTIPWGGATPGQCPTQWDRIRELRAKFHKEHMLSKDESDEFDRLLEAASPSPRTEESSWEAIADRLKGQVYKWQTENERLREALRQLVEADDLSLEGDIETSEYQRRMKQAKEVLAARESGDAKGVKP